MYILPSGFSAFKPVYGLAVYTPTYFELHCLFQDYLALKIAKNKFQHIVQKSVKRRQSEFLKVGNGKSENRSGISISIQVFLIFFEDLVFCVGICLECLFCVWIRTDSYANTALNTHQGAVGCTKKAMIPFLNYMQFIGITLILI